MDLLDPLMLSGIAGLAVVVLFLILMIKRLKPGREVLYLRERDRRGQRLRIDEETATAISCKSRKGGLNKRFFKYGGSYTFLEAGKQITRFFAKEGSAYTYKFETNEKSENSEDTRESTKMESVQCPACSEVFETEISVPSGGGTKGRFLGGIKEVLETMWGKNFYSEIPEEQREMIEDSKVYVTVELEPGLTPEGYSPISEEDIDEEQDRTAARIFTRALGPSVKSELYKGFLWAALGSLLTFIAFNFGLFHI